MVDEIDIWRAAQVLSGVFGPTALFVTGQQAYQLRDAGDIVGYSVWQRITTAIMRLEELEPIGTIH